MAYILKIKKGNDIGKYVGRKGIRSWDWKPQDNPNNARIFASLSGIKCFHGEVYNKEEKDKLDIEWRNETDKEKVRKEYIKKYKKIQVPFSDYYEVIEINIKDNTEG